MQTINIRRGDVFLARATDYFPKDMILKGKPVWSLIGEDPRPVKLEVAEDGMTAKISTVGADPDASRTAEDVAAEVGMARVLIRANDDSNPDNPPDEAMLDIQVTDR